MRTSLSQKVQQYLGSLSQTVAHYQPRIEQKVSQLAGKPFSLGPVGIRDMRYLAGDAIDFMYPEGGLGWVLQKFIFSRLREQLDLDVQVPIQNGDLAWFNNTIYASYKRAYDPKTNSKLQIPRDVVHEISHGIFLKRLGNQQSVPDINQNPKDSKEFNQVSQAFALYCEQFLFRNLYPKEVQREVVYKLRDEQSEEFTQKRQHIERLVRKQGEKALLEIPKNWREYQFLSSVA